MKYLVVGAGGTGACLAAYLALGGKDVEVIARGEHLRAIRAHGLVLESAHRGTLAVPVSACTMEEYAGSPDVIFLCVKGYSVDGCVPFLRRVARPDAVVIPILNVYGTGGMLQKQLPDTLVTDGCIYIAAEIKSPGTILMSGEIFRVLFGVREERDRRPMLEEVERDLCACGIRGELSSDIRRDAMLKFSYVSPMAACGLYYDVKAAEMQRPGQERDAFAALILEVVAVAAAMGIRFPCDPVQRNLDILDDLAPGASTSLKRDVDAGKPSEIDGLIFQVVRLGRELGVPTPWYSRVADKFGFAG